MLLHLWLYSASDFTCMWNGHMHVLDLACFCHANEQPLNQFLLVALERSVLDILQGLCIEE